MTGETMSREPARVLGAEDVRRLIRYTEGNRHTERNTVIVLLSFKAGLRACEISGLTWPMVLTPSGRLAEHISISKHIAKYGSGRRIPLHHDLRRALRLYHKAVGRPKNGPVVRSERGGHMTARSIVNWFHGTYSGLGLEGCSSHSGRRTFITRSARAITRIGGSLRDVQELAGHRALTTTERYIAGDRDAQRRLICLI
jgi:integrase/recombinase XerD